MLGAIITSGSTSPIKNLNQMKLPLLKRTRPFAIPKRRVQTLNETKMKTTKLKLSLIFTALTALTFVGVHSTMAQGGTWTTKAPMPEPRVESAAAAVNGRMYYSVIGIDYTFGLEKRS